jgi:lipoprotein signal peptidase
MGLVPGKNLFLFLASGGLILASDQLSKILIRFRGGSFICNPDIAFGINIPDTLFWIFWTIIICLIIYLYKNYFIRDTLYVAPILFGAASNLIDRIWHGCVIDFIQLGWWPIFNLADFFITLGAIMLLLNHLKVKR